MLISAISNVLKQLQSRTAFGADILPSVNALVGNRVRIGRISRGISQQELSTRLEIKGDDLAAYEAGAEHISANLLFRIAKVLDVRPDYFFRSSSAEDAKAA
jgi:transcriptional regulator with XRE-family HTH domain